MVLMPTATRGNSGTGNSGTDGGKLGDGRDVTRAQVNMTYNFSATQNNGRIV